jgi:hypothetical protein
LAATRPDVQDEGAQFGRELQDSQIVDSVENERLLGAGAGNELSIIRNNVDGVLIV